MLAAFEGWPSSVPLNKHGGARLAACDCLVATGRDGVAVLEDEAADGDWRG